MVKICTKPHLKKVVDIYSPPLKMYHVSYLCGYIAEDDWDIVCKYEKYDMRKEASTVRGRGGDVLDENQYTELNALMKFSKSGTSFQFNVKRNVIGSAVEFGKSIAFLGIKRHFRWNPIFTIKYKILLIIANILNVKEGLKNVA